MGEHLHDTGSGSQFELTTKDVNLDDLVITLHPTFDDLINHIRATYDPSGYYDGEGSGSLQNMLEGEGYEFNYRKIPRLHDDP